MDQTSLEINLSHHDWQKLRQYCQVSGKTEAELFSEFIDLINLFGMPENREKIIQFQQFAQEIPLPLMLVDKNQGIIQYINPKALSILGFSDDDIKQRSLSYLCHESTNKQEFLTALAIQEESKNYELKWQKKDGNSLWISAFIQPLLWIENTLLISWCDITQHYQVEQTLKEKENILQLVLDNIPQLIFWKDRNSVFVGCNHSWAKAVGLNSPDEVVGKTDQDIYASQNNRHIDPPIHNLNYYRQEDQEVIKTGNPKLHFIEHKLNPEGREVWYNTNKIPIKDSDKNIIGVMGTIENITDHELTKRALLEEKNLAQITLQSIGEAVITTNNQGIIKEFNPMAEQLTRWTKKEAIGEPLSKIFQLRNENGQLLPNPVTQILQKNQSIRVRNLAILVAKDGNQCAIDNITTPIYDQDNQILGTVLIFRDVTQFSQLAHQLAWEASHDKLTGLANRGELERQLSIALENSKNQGIENVLCYLDLDQFKVINDNCGHIAGDELLRQLTRMLQQNIRATDTLARMGGDEFVLLLKGCSLVKAETIADTLRQLVKNFRFTWQGQPFSVGVSIGIVEINEETSNISDVLSLADEACFTAKDKGRNCVYIYQENDQKLAQKRGERQWIFRLNKALYENQFRLFFQKIETFNSAKKQPYEIFLRLLDESGNLIQPMAFIPAANRYNLMAEIDRWVIKNFMRTYDNYCQQKSAQDQSLSHDLYMINLSAASVNHESFFDFLQEQLSIHQVNPQNLCFEITETVAITNLNQTIKLIEFLKQLGCLIALDDFGSGMSSLSYLKNLAVDYLKVDVRCLQNAEINSVDYAFIDYFNRISNIMKIDMIAEFVENKKILDKVKNLGIDYAQGFELAYPIPFTL